MSTLLKAACSAALAASLWAQVTPKVEGHESPADVARRAAEREGSEASTPLRNPFDSEQDVQKGNVLFQTHCSYCHGTYGAGGRGADLTTGIYRFGGSDAELFRTIRNGIPGSEMGPPRVDDDDLWRIIGFVKKLGLAPPEELPGDAAQGKQAYLASGCNSCHSINGEGGTLGPDLSDVGRRRGLSHLQESLLKPEADLPTNYRGTRLVTMAGETIAGIRLNEDDYSIQIRDTNGNPRSFVKDKLQRIQRDDPSLMPAYGSTLSEQQIKDLISYLATLKGTL